MARKFPKDNQDALIAYYGDPASAVASQLVSVIPPFKIYYGDKLISKVTFHKKAASELMRVLDKIWNYYGRDQNVLDKLDISKFSGTYNPRLVRGSKTKWSNHAYGAAWDMDAEDNGFGQGRGDIPFPVIAAFKSEGFTWGGDYKGRTDPMHFEACDRGEPVRTFKEWLEFYKQPLSYSDKPFAKPKPAPKPVDPFDHEPTMPNVEPEQPPPLTMSAPKTVKEETRRGVYSLETERVQMLLKRLGYAQVGEIDGVWGGSTTGAIASFKSDRAMPGLVTINQALLDELDKAEQEGFTRPITEQRANATPAQLTSKLPDVAASVTAERAGFWASIATGASAIVTGITKSTSDAVDMLSPLKTFIADLPWTVWVGLALVVSVALYYLSRKAGDAAHAATRAYQTGERA